MCYCILIPWKDACLVVDWSNIVIGLRQALEVKSNLACPCKARYDALLESLDETLAKRILSGFERYLRVFLGHPANCILKFEKKWIVGNERLWLDDRVVKLKARIGPCDLRSRLC